MYISWYSYSQDKRLGQFGASSETSADNGGIHIGFSSRQLSAKFMILRKYFFLNISVGKVDKKKKKRILGVSKKYCEDFSCRGIVIPPKPPFSVATAAHVKKVQIN